MNKSKLNLYIDLLFFSSFILMILTGLIIWFVLPPGTNKDLMLWGLSRHEWGTIHSWASILMCSIMLVHIFLHWRWIVSMFSSRVGKNNVASFWIAVLFAVALLIFISTFILVTKRCVTKIPDQCTFNIFTNLSYAEELDNFTKIRDFTEKNCAECHSKEKAKGDFRVDDLNQILNDPKWVNLNSPEKSELLSFLNDPPADLKRRQKHLLSAPDIQIFLDWINNSKK